MDFGGFFLIGGLALALLVGLVHVAALFNTRRRWRGFGLWLGGVAILALFGHFLYQVYGLDERLYIAAAGGDSNQVKALLSAGASPNAAWEDGTSALSAARSNGHKDVVMLLEKAGAEK
jgi:hypothetical protein